MRHCTWKIVGVSLLCLGLYAQGTPAGAQEDERGGRSGKAGASHRDSTSDAPNARDARPSADAAQRDTTPEINSRIVDSAALFSEEERVRAQRLMGDLERRSGVPVVVETVESLAGERIDDAALDRAKRSGSQGIFILISRNDHKISDPLVSRRWLTQIDPESRRTIRDAFTEDFRRERYNAGLEKAIAAIESVLDRKKILGRFPSVSTPGREAAPAPASEFVHDRQQPRLVARGQTRLTLAGAKRLAEAAEAKATELKFKMNIAVVDDGGHLLFFLRMDGARPASAATAITKATSAATFRQATGPLPATGPADTHLSLAVENAAAAGGAKVTTLKGGVPVTIDSQVIGAIGAAGGSGEDDSKVARAAVEAFIAEVDRSDQPQSRTEPR